MNPTDTELTRNQFSREIPTVSGWWFWKEEEDSDPVRLLIAANARHAEVATDSALCKVTGRDYPEDGECLPDNYWEMTACAEMGGFWLLEKAFQFSN